jgi:nitrile hydratase
LEEFGTVIDDQREVRVHDSTADMRYLVLPKRPDGTEELSEEDLVRIIGRDALIGVVEVKTP